LIVTVAELWIKQRRVWHEDGKSSVD